MADYDWNTYFGPTPDPFPGLPNFNFSSGTGSGANTLPAPKKSSPNPYAHGLQAFGAGYSALSARTQAQGQKNLLGYEAQVAGNQAAIAGYQADIAQQVGAAREQDSRLQTAAQFGSERAHMAAGGIDLGQGSATDVLASTEYMGERNAMMIRDDTNRQVWQDRNQQSMYQSEQQAKLAQMDAINPDRAAFGSLLGSVFLRHGPVGQVSCQALGSVCQHLISQ
jgi:hypothetical protein